MNLALGTPSRQLAHPGGPNQLPRGINPASRSYWSATAKTPMASS
jgi:hypothetical protein